MTTTALVLAVALLLVGLAVGFVLGRLVAQGRATAQLATATAELEAGRAAATARLTAEREAAERRIDDLRTNQADLEARISQLSREALAQNSEQLLALASERFAAQRETAEHDLATRQQAIETLVGPLAKSLEQVQQRIAEIETTRTEAYAALREQVSGMKESSEQLRTETRQLVTALRAPQVRGRWGEHQLRRVVEVAGLVQHCDFSEQLSVTGSEGQVLRPDLVVHLAGGRHIVVDAKVTFAGYLEAMDAADDAVRAERLKAHARHFRTHVDGLAGKQYWEHLEPTPDFVVMFVPSDVFLNAALEQDPSLLEYAFERNVVVATPATLVALLRTVAYSWRQEALAANAREVYALGKELYSRLSTMGGHVTTLGKQLGGAVKAYNQAVGSLESRVLVQARRFADLQVADQALDEMTPLEVAPRMPQAEELVGWDSQGLRAISGGGEDTRSAG